MDYKTALSQLTRIGLSVTESGRITDTEYDYGVLEKTDLHKVTGEYVSLETIALFSFSPHPHELQITFDDGSSQIVYGDHYVIDDVASIVKKNMPVTTAELNAVFPALYPHATTQLYYDELLERDMVDMSMFDRPGEGVRPINDNIVAIYYENLELKLVEHGFIGKPPAFIVRDNVLKIQTHNNRRNQFREWVESHTWDGVPRVRTWFKDLFGASAPPLDEAGLADRYLGDVAEAWFVGGIKRMYSETKHEIVPVLIGDQGIGKGMGLKYTAGQDWWYTDTSVNIKEPERFLDGVRGNVIVEMSESTQLRSSEAEALKAFISKSSDQLRKAYARYNERFPRHFILVATSNLDNIFTDVTGNRRFFPMYCKPDQATLKFSQDRTVGQYEVEQVWSEALHMYRNGSRWYMSEDSARIARVMQDFGTVENTSVSIIDDFLDDPRNGYAFKESADGKPVLITKEIIMDRVFGIDTHSEIIPKDVDSAYRLWTYGTKSWVKCPKPVRIGGKPCRAYERILNPGETKDVKRIGIVEGITKLTDDTSGGDLVQIMRTRSEKYGFKDAGDPFPTEGLTQTLIDAMLMQGYIYEPYYANPPVYNLSVLP